MKLYAVVGSPNSRKALATVQHLGVDLEIEYLDLFAGETQQPGFKALNPNAMVPCLTDGEFKLWESNAIMQYIADKAGDNDLYPKDLSIRADINRWQCWELAHFNQAFGTLAFESVAKPAFFDAPGDAAAIERATNQLQRFATVLNNHLEGRDFMVGDSITLADYSIIHVEFFKEQVPFDWSPYPHLNRYFEQMRQSTHWARTAPKTPSEIGRVPGR